MKKSRYEILKERYASEEKPIEQPKLSEEILKMLVFADPTTRVRNEIDIKAGQYVNWIIKQYLRILEFQRAQFVDLRTNELVVTVSNHMADIFIEDLYKITEDLQKFHRIKSTLPLEKRDINKYSPDTLYKSVKNVDTTLVSTTKRGRKEAEIHPGAKLYYDGEIWRVIVIEKYGELEKEAACFYGGYHKETRWCTAAPGLNYFQNYIKRGCLYILYRKNDSNLGKLTNLPLERYQFHFEDNMFMDADDSAISITDFLENEMCELKNVFKSNFINSLVSDKTKLIVQSLARGVEANIIKLYGVEELFNYLPETIEEIVIQNRDVMNIKIDFKVLTKFKSLKMLLLDNCVNELPENLFELPSLRFVSLINNYELKKLPSSLFKSSSLEFLCLRGSDNAVTPEIDNFAVYIGDKMWDFSK